MRPHTYQFGDFELDTRSQVLRSLSSGATATLPGRTFATLACFLQRPGEVLDKATLIAEIWPNVVVEDNNLEQHISALRHLLGERRGDNRYIVTVYGRGYRFVPAVVAFDQSPPSPSQAPDTESRQRPRWAFLRTRPFAALLAGSASILLAGGIMTLVSPSAFEPAAPQTPAGLSGAAARAPARVTDDAKAYQLYANGQYHRHHTMSEDGLRAAIDYYEAAIARDPGFALAYVGLAEANSILGVFSIEAPSAAFPKALAAIERALAIAPNLGEAYASLGHIKAQYQHDWDGAERAYRRALELSPRYAPAQQWYGHYLAYSGRIEEGLEQLRKAQALDPTAPSLSALIGMFLNYQRRYDEAIEQLRRTLEMNAHFDLAHTYLGVSYLRLGDYERAAHHFRQPRSATPGSDAFMGQLYARSGRRDEALAEIERLQALAPTRRVSAYGIASIHAELGDVDAALHWLERAFDDHSQTIGWLPWEPAFDAVRGDPRYAALVAKLPYRER